MNLLLDTHVVLAMIEERTEALPPGIRAVLDSHQIAVWVSIASLWEIAIKSRIGKLPLVTPLIHWPEALLVLGAQLMDIKFPHIFAEIGPEPATNDPFDRLLLSVCAAEKLRLLTLDRALVGHALAWRSVPAVKK
ncbi:MAG: type II toxin-antitoxin system VapC family toxin [Rhizobiales bacterium]|nr:type II toxin-antitoxin system VapC family toxin [Hyphomicrobiales bacterium]